MERSAEACPDVVLMDIRSQGTIDGVSAATMLQQRFDVPIVYLTAHADEATLEIVRSTGPYAYLVKPVKPGELRSAIEIAVHKFRIDKEMLRNLAEIRAVLENIGDGVVVADADGRFTHFNPAARRILGRGPDADGPEEWSRQFSVVGGRVGQPR